MRAIVLLTALLISGCSYCDIVVTAPAGTTGTATCPNTITVDVNQGRKGLDSLFDGVQANVPLQGSTITSPSNTKTTDNVKN